MSEVDKLELHLKYLFDYGVNLKNRIITLVGEVDEAMFERLDAGLTELESHNLSNITIRLKSGGGETYTAAAIVGRIKASKAKKITIEGYGQIMSAATLILGCGDHRKLSAYAWLMWHETQHHQGADTILRTSQMKAEIQQEDREHKKWCSLMAEFSEKSQKFWEDNGKFEDFFFYPEDALEFGLVDEIF